MSYSNADAEKIAHDYYGLEVSAGELPSYDDTNFSLQGADGQGYVLKIANPQTERTQLEFQDQVINRLEQLPVPRVLPAVSGKKIIELDGGRLARLITRLPGRLMGDLAYHSPALLQEVGGLLGRLDRALAGFSHPGMHRELDWDLLHAGKVVRMCFDALPAGRKRELVSGVLDGFESFAAPELAGLPAQVIHNDGNEFNILVQDGSVSGLIDFGDILYAPRICELAIAAAYAGLNKPDPLQAMAEVAAGYHAANPLEEAEIAVLFGLAQARLAVSVTMAARRAQTDPESEYHQVSALPAWMALEKLSEVHPNLAHYVFRHACGWEPCPDGRRVRTWLAANARAFAPVIGIPSGCTAPLDLSIRSLLVRSPESVQDTGVFTGFVEKFLHSQDASFGVGGYGEARLVYTTDAYRELRNDGDEWRTVHTAFDIWGEAGTEVHVPLDGVVHSFADNNAHRDYGPAIILSHTVETGEGGLNFYTLYGHLSRSSLAGMYVGKPVKKGEMLAEIGRPAVNGGWPPHLHFQVIADLLGMEGDFPGVALPSQQDIFCSICPDPNLILGFPPEALPSKPPAVEKLLSTRRDKLGYNLSVSYDQPLHIVRGHGQYLYSVDGQRYLDCVNNVCHVGHSHPHVAGAIARQAAVLNTNTRYLHENIVRLAERLAATMPDTLSVCYFVNSGSEANDLALRLARAYTGQKDMLVLEGAYHGNLTSSVALSPYKFDGPGGQGAPGWVHALPLPCAYRGAYRDAEDPAVKYASQAGDAISQVQGAGRGLAGFISESIIGTGGQVIFPEGYLAAVYALVRAAGGVCIADEVQHGFGRVGTHYWGFETHGVVPDIVTVGKPFGNGHPLAAVVTTPDIARAFHNGMEYFNTFGGNPVSCAAGLAVMDVIEQEGLQAHALEMGKLWKEGMQDLQARYPLIGDVRGSGLFLGMELVLDPDTLVPAAHEAGRIVNMLRAWGMLLSTDGPLHNVIKIKPPMVIARADIERVVAEMRRAFSVL